MNQHPLRSAISQEAIEWFVLNREGEIEGQRQAAFLEWLKASPLCVEEYLRIAVISRNLREAVNSTNADLNTCSNERTQPGTTVWTLKPSID
jgi:ferric-dicitrate binding protein FerR (iron transport regulator)